jgi:hypothetical protein
MERVMFCHHCGRHIDDNDRFCPYCGYKNDSDSLPETEKGIKPYDAPEVVNDRGPHILGILSLVLGVFSLGVLGLILGIIGLSTARKVDNRILNIVGIIISAFMLILAALTYSRYFGS